MRTQRGFSLVELLLAVAIILIIAAIAVPNLLRSRVAGNEASAVASIRTIASTNLMYNSSYGAFPASLGTLGGTTTQCVGGSTSTTACLVDNSLAMAVDAAHAKSGYFFDSAANSTLGFTAHATPAVPGVTGLRYFYSDQPAVIHFNLSGPASANDPSI